MKLGDILNKFVAYINNVTCLHQQIGQNLVLGHISLHGKANRWPPNYSNSTIEHSHDTPNNLLLYGLMCLQLKVSKNPQENGVKE